MLKKWFDSILEKAKKLELEAQDLDFDDSNESLDQDYDDYQESKNTYEQESQYQDEQELEELGETEELKIDLIDKSDHILLYAFVPASLPSNIDLTISRDMVSIEVTRALPADYPQEGGDFFAQELYWGKLVRKVLLPEEVEPDESSASEHKGVLKLTMPKINKKKKTKIKVKSR